jgi:PAP2 superfamily
MTVLAPADPLTSRAPWAATSGATVRHAFTVRWAAELGLLVLLYAGYIAARAVMGVHIGAAQLRGQQILDLEAMAHLDVERALNTALTAVPPLGLLFAYLYATLHYVVTPAVLVWIAARRRDGYRSARNALLAATAIGLIGYWLLPTAPPRLLGAGFTDTMATFSGVGWWGAAASAPRGMEAMSNQWAALPSLHVGWAMWVALCLHQHSSSGAIRRWVWAYPALMTVVVMATANHYLVDAMAGIACACLGNWLAHRGLDRNGSRRGQGVGDRPEMAYVGAAAAAQDGEAREVVAQSCVTRAEVLRVARVERRGLVQLGMALARGVGAQSAQSRRPRSGRVQEVRKVGRVGAVDAVVGGGATGRVVHALDSRPERGAVGECTVGLDRERDGDGDLCRRSREHHTDGFVRVGDRHRVHHVGVGRREGLHLFGVIVARLIRLHPRSAVIAVSARAEAPAHDHVGFDAQLVAQVEESFDSETVRLGQRRAVIAEQVSPVGVGAPGRGLEDESGARLRGHARMLEKVAIESQAAGLVTQQGHG